MKSAIKKELTIGALAILALALLIFGIDFLKGINVFKAANYYYVQYTDVEGLAISAPVNLNGTLSVSASPMSLSSPVWISWSR